MKPVPLTTNPNLLVRAMDVMSAKKNYILLGLFAATNVVLVCCLAFGPPQSHTQMVPFETASVAKNSQKFHIHVGKFNFLNSYAVVDVVFVRGDANRDPEFGFKATVVGHAVKGRRQQIIFDRRVDCDRAYFAEGATVSQRTRLFSTEFTDFEKLDLEVLMKYTYKDQVSGVFIIYYSDLAYSLVEILIRLLLFFIDVATFVYLQRYDATRFANPFQLNVIKVLLIASVLAADPLYAFSYFTDSFVIPMFDAFLCIVLIVLTAAASLILIDCEGTSKVDLEWIMKEAAPFLISGFLYILNDFIAHVRLRDETDVHVPTYLLLLSYLRSISAGICFVRILLALLTMKTTGKYEQVTFGVMIMLTFIFCLGSELSSVKPRISAHELHIYTYAAVSIYILFLAKCYWPADPDSDDSTDGEVYEE